MIKNYTNKEYASKAVEANSKGLSLYILITPTEFTGEDEQGQSYKYTEDVATLVLAKTGYYVTYNGNYTDGTINESLEEEKAEQETKRILELKITKNDFFDATIKAFGLNDEDLLPIVEQLLNQYAEQGEFIQGVPNEVSIKIALNNYKNAGNFYRKHSLFDILSKIDIPITPEYTIKITAEQWDKFFNEMDKKNPDAYKILNGTY